MKVTDGDLSLHTNYTRAHALRIYDTYTDTEGSD